MSMTFCMNCGGQDGETHEHHCQRHGIYGKGVRAQYIVRSDACGSFCQFCASFAGRQMRYDSETGSPIAQQSRRQP